MTDRSAELHTWLAELETSHTEAEHAIGRGARAILASIEQAPASTYRDMALCRLTDTIIMAAVACRQPQPESQSAAKSG